MRTAPLSSAGSLPAPLVDALLTSGLRVRWLNRWAADQAEVRKTVHDHATCWLALGFPASIYGGSFVLDLAVGQAALVPAGTKMRIVAQPSRGTNLAFGFVIEPIVGPDPLVCLPLPQAVAIADPEAWRQRFAGCALPVGGEDRAARLSARPLCDAFVQEHLAAGFTSGHYRWAQGPIPDWLRQAHDHLRTIGISHEHTMSDLARSCGVSPTHLARAFTAAFGCTPVAFRQRHRLAHAARMLRGEPSTELAEIALRCGYRSVTAFVRAFTIQYGAPPRRFLRAAAATC